LLALPGPEAVDVDQQANPALGLPQDREPGQLLEGVESLAVGPDEGVQVGAFQVDVAPNFVDPCGDVAVDIQRVQ
jgi:hypothetical protein